MENETVAVATATGFKIDESLIKSIAIRDYASGVRFEEGTEYEIEMLESTEEVSGVNYPNFKLGEITMNLHSLASLYVNDDKVVIANVGTPGECLPYGTNLTRFKDLIAESGEVPNKIKCVKRIKQGATARYLTGEHEVARKNAYKLNKMEDVLKNTDFPMLVLRKGQNANEADAWKAYDSVTIAPVV